MSQGDSPERRRIEAMTTGKPLVSIGMPVFNGERFLARALDSLLAQDYPCFELIISDNASTDATPLICLEYTERDQRIRYSRNEINLGSAPNFNRVFEHAGGEYFMWAAHDDEWDPTYIGKCIALLDKHPSAILALSDIGFIGEDGEPLPGWQYDNIDTLGMDVAGRIHELISRMGWFAIYGLIRPEALRATHLFEEKYGTDVLLMLELLLQGDFVKVPEPLFRYRLPQQLKTAREYVLDLTAHENGSSIEKPYLGMARGLLEIVLSSDLDPEIKQRIKEDFVRTLTFQNREWRDRIMQEQGLPLQGSCSTKRIFQLMPTWLSPAKIKEGAYKPIIADKRSPLVVAFFPHNLFPPRTGAHHRCMQVLNGLIESGCEVVLCSSTLFSDTPWSETSQRSLRREGLADVRVYEPHRADTIFCGFLSRFYSTLRIPMPLTSFSYTPPGLLLWFSRLLRDLDPDIVLINYAYWDRLAWNRPRGALRVIDYYDILSRNLEMRKALERLLPIPPIRPAEVDGAILEESFFSGLDYPQRDKELGIFDKYDFTLCINRQEASLIEQQASHTRVLFLPLVWKPADLENTYDGPALFPTGPNPFNLQGYLYLARKVLPRVLDEVESFSLQVTGSCCDLVAPVEGVELTGYVPDLAALYAKARFVVCPVFGGTGQQIKITEAMAHGVPVIALRSAAEATPLQHGVSGWIADDEAGFAEGMVQLWRDRELCRRLGEKARDVIAESFSQERLLEGLSPLLDVFSASRGSAGTPSRAF
jgi:glycosyltransferase involved in cell wall biosynthesis